MQFNQRGLIAVLPGSRTRISASAVAQAHMPTPTHPLTTTSTATITDTWQGAPDTQTHMQNDVFSSQAHATAAIAVNDVLGSGSHPAVSF
jgi:microcystin-dependent protein